MTSSDRRTLVYLVRHGQTPLNESGVLLGLLDPPLDDVGHHQARRLGAVLGSRGLSAVVASPLRRARETAQPVADRAGLKVATDRRLVDRDYGRWAGTSRESVVARWGSVDGAPGVEPLVVVRDKAVECLTDIARRAHGGMVVAVRHDAVNRQALVAFDADLGDPDALPQENGWAAWPFPACWSGSGYQQPLCEVGELGGCEPADQHAGECGDVLTVQERPGVSEKAFHLVKPARVVDPLRHGRDEGVGVAPCGVPEALGERVGLGHAVKVFDDLCSVLGKFLVVGPGVRFLSCHGVAVLLLQVHVRHTEAQPQSDREARRATVRRARVFHS